MLAYAIYYRYGHICKTSYVSVEQATEFLQNGEEMGSHSSVGVISNNILYVPIIRMEDFGRETLRSIDGVFKVIPSFAPSDVRHYKRFSDCE